MNINFLRSPLGYPIVPIYSMPVYFHQHSPLSSSLSPTCPIDMAQPAFAAPLPLPAKVAGSRLNRSCVRARVSAPPRANPRRPARPTPNTPQQLSSLPTTRNLVDEAVKPRLLARAVYLGPVALHKVQSAIELAEALRSPAVAADNLAVADICVQLCMDCDTVCAAVLRGLAASAGHDAVDAAVGSSVLSILAAYERIEEIVVRAEEGSFTEASYAHLRELVLIAARDEHRALTLRLAASVVDVRDLGLVLNPEQRELVARRTMYLDAALANQLGMWYLQSELEENSFRHLHPTEYASTKDALSRRKSATGDLLEDTRGEIETIMLRARGVRAVVARARVVGRVKGAYSVHRKMKRTGKRLDQIFDVLALRIIIAPKRGGDDTAECNACYAVAEAVRQNFPVLEGREKDYLVQPKSNGYRSLHLTILAGEGFQPLEVQIRTEKMHHVAEFGAAAHWVYKGVPPGIRGNMFMRGGNQTRNIPYPRPRIPLNIGPAAEADAKRKGYVTHIADAIAQTRVIVKSCGQLYTLALGSTLADLCKGLGMMSLGVVPFVNGTIAPLSQKLQMNDIVRFSIALQDL